MKRKLLYLSILLIIVLIILFSKLNRNNQFALEPLKVTDWTSITQNNSPTFVYVGRDSCDECAEFRPMLEKFLMDNHIKAYYFDTSINKENTETIIKKYNIIGVPTIIVLKNNDYYIIMDENHQNMLNQIKSAFN